MVDRAVIDDLRAVWGSLSELGDQLTEQQWHQPTDCPGWSVKDQLAHVVGTESALAGREKPGRTTDRTYMPNELAASNQDWVDAFREVAGPELLRRFAELRELRLDALRRMSDEGFSTETEGPVGRMPYQDFMRIRVMDCWTHEQDIRHAVGRPGGLGGPAGESAVDTLLKSLGFVIGKKVKPAENTVVQTRVHGPVERIRSTAVVEGRAGPVEDSREATTTVSLDTTTFGRLATGRWTPRHPEAVIEITGDHDLGWSVVDNLATTP